ncbi:MAG: hypothetical protein AB200_00045 [Parcubacteria bacterium C7867-005]|nr:MAG: hypothetical protein AB200_00045 [Parcubacteria bacterium C7867-005]
MRVFIKSQCKKYNGNDVDQKHKPPLPCGWIPTPPIELGFEPIALRVVFQISYVFCEDAHMFILPALTLSCLFLKNHFAISISTMFKRPINITPITQLRGNATVLKTD